ncbi:MAG TPA: hypothetical protein PK657_00550 [Legionella sp.]|nr:hypothetical protein [Legionella sp.]
MIKSKKLSNASSYFFFSGFIVSKIRFLPFVVVTPILTLVSLLLNCIGYTIWFISSHFQQEHERDETKWYGFAQFKDQHLLAASLGLMATTLSIISIVLPLIFIPAVWLFFASNVVWCTGEYHKWKNPPQDDENYSATRQEKYFAYTRAMAMTALINAISSTLIIMFPPLSIPLLIGATLLCLGPVLLAAENWMEFKFGNHKQLTQCRPSTSYDVIEKSLQLEVSPMKKIKPRVTRDSQKPVQTKFALCQSSLQQANIPSKQANIPSKQANTPSKPANISVISCP